MKNLQKKASPFFQLFLIFIIISFLGWCIETLYFLIAWNDLTDRGFLSMPLCTIYGCSLMAIYLIIGTPEKGRLKALFGRAKKLPLIPKIISYTALYFFYFIIAALIPTITEFFTALFFDKLFGIRLWDYSNYTYHLYGYICLEFSLAWGILITLAMSLIWPVIAKLVNKIPYKIVKILSISFIVLLFTDFIINMSYLIVKKKYLILY